MIGVGVIGVGTVGSSVVRAIKKNRDIIRARSGKKIFIQIGAVKDLSKDRKSDIPLTDNMMDVVEDPKVDIVVELINNIDDALRVAKRALELRKPLITANKAMLAYHKYELQKIAKGTPIGFEASVGAGIPIIRALRDGLSANHIISIRGILNGTCNFILTKMLKNNISFNRALQISKNLGYCEANPSLDIDGFDTAYKLLILAGIAYGIKLKPEDIIIEGIRNIDKKDVLFAVQFGYVVKLLAIARVVGKKVELRVHPTFISKSSMIAKADGVMNAISVVGDFIGETMYYGPGAGGDSTASAIVSDIIGIVRSQKSSPMLGFKEPLEKGLGLMDKNDICTQYYLRICVMDKIGVLASITNVLAQNNISVKTFFQDSKKNSDGSIDIMFCTYTCCEKLMQKALKAISKFDFVVKKIFMIRVDD